MRFDGDSRYDIAWGIVLGWVGIQVVSFCFTILLSLVQYWIANVVVVK